MSAEKRTAVASLRALKISPLKLRKITSGISGLHVQEAMKMLTFCNMRAAKNVKELVKSAMANAENNHGMDIDNLYIHEIYTGKAFVMKRFRARARGRGTRILKPFSNIKIVLIEKEA